MKKCIFPVILFLVSMAGFAQDNTITPVLSKVDLLQKSKNQRTAGWVLMGTGTALTIAGGIVMIDAIGNDLFEGDNNYDRKSTTAGVLVVTGLAAIGGSIPLLISGHRNHKKAMAMAITNKSMQVLLNGGWSYQAYPALSITIYLGRK